MIVHFLMGGESVAIPKTQFDFGVGQVKLWIDGMGYTSATNSLGALGYVLLETKDVDIGPVDDARQQAFANLHGQNVKFTVDPNKFIKDGGIAKIKMAVQSNAGGTGDETSIEFVANNCTGVSITAGPMEFLVEMLQMPVAMAQLDHQQVISDDDVTAIADAAPQDNATA